VGRDFRIAFGAATLACSCGVFFLRYDFRWWRPVEVWQMKKPFLAVFSHLDYFVR
jgi:hypothetical protein